jgi:hypothetical protein
LPLLNEEWRIRERKQKKIANRDNSGKRPELKGSKY